MVAAYAALIGDYPKLGSPGDQADQAILLWLQRSRTREDVLRATSEEIPHLGVFSAAVGQNLDSGQYPLTQALAGQAMDDLRQITGALKLKFARPRPYAAMEALRPAIEKEPSFAYPSGHGAWGVLEAALLAQLQPGKQDVIQRCGRQVGYDRVLGGVHYPTDVDAGQRLGTAFAEAWLAEPGIRTRVEQAREAEWR
jgi:acid phosphatase (class A)